MYSSISLDHEWINNHTNIPSHMNIMILSETGNGDTARRGMQKISISSAIIHCEWIKTSFDDLFFGSQPTESRQKVFNQLGAKDLTRRQTNEIVSI